MSPCGDSVGQECSLEQPAGLPPGVMPCSQKRDCWRMVLLPRGAPGTEGSANKTAELDSSLDRDCRQAGPQGIKAHRCEACRKSFKYNSLLLQHQRTHTGEKPYACRCECGKHFGSWWGFLQHQRIHTCGECGHAFSQSSNLVRHQRLHTREKPCVCSRCGKAFTWSSVLIEHQRIHTGEKPSRCEDCGMAFRGQSHFFRHFRAHTGEKPFACSTCGKAFGQSYQLIQHQRLHYHEERSPQ